MHQPDDLAQALLGDQQAADDFDTPGGRSRRTADETRENQQHRQRPRPRGIVRRRESGGRANGDGLEQAVDDAVAEVRVGPPIN